MIEAQLVQSLRFISSKVQGTQKNAKQFGDRESKIYLKQAFFNYLLLVVNDPRGYFSHEKLEQTNHTNLNFNFEGYIKSKQATSQQFYSQLCQTQVFNEFLHRV